MPSRDGVFANNIVWFERGVVSSEEINVGPNTAPETFTFLHDLYYAYDDPTQSAVDTPVAEIMAIVGEDPGFAAVDTLDVAVGTGSPAYHAGAPAWTPRGDHVARCYDEPPTVGALEATD